jgi:hypothetical protein
MTSVAGAGQRGEVSAGETRPGRPRPRHTGRWVLRSNILTFYLRSRVTLQPEQLRVVTHRTLLGIVPLGTLTREIALDALESVSVRLVVRPARLVVATGLVGAALLVPMPMLVRLVALLLAVALVFLGIALGIRVKTRDGERFAVPVCVVQRGAAGAAVQQVERALRARRTP